MAPIQPRDRIRPRASTSKLRRDAGEPLDEETALLLMARHVLGGPTDEGRASYQIALTLCQQCARGFQQGHGDSLEVDSAITQMVLCDAQHIGHVDAGGATHVLPASDAKTGASFGSGDLSIGAHVGSEAHVDRRAHVGREAHVAAATTPTNSLSCALHITEPCTAAV